MTYRGLKICARVGFGKDPSQLREDFRRGIAEHQKNIRLRFREKDRQFMVLVDDKNGNWTGPLGGSTIFFPNDERKKRGPEKPKGVSMALGCGAPRRVPGPHAQQPDRDVACGTSGSIKCQI